MKNDQLTH